MQPPNQRISAKNLQISRLGLVMAALAALSIGLAIYMLDRQPLTVHRLGEGLMPGGSVNGVFGPLGSNLPSFLHVYAFTLLSVAVAAQTHRQVVVIGMAWLLIDGIFEFAQIDRVARFLVAETPAWFSNGPGFGSIADYFLKGVFDPADVLFIAAGSFAAYSTVVAAHWGLTRTRGDRSIRHHPCAGLL